MNNTRTKQTAALLDLGFNLPRSFPDNLDGLIDVRASGAKVCYASAQSKPAVNSGI